MGLYPGGPISDDSNGDVYTLHDMITDHEKKHKTVTLDPAVVREALGKVQAAWHYRGMKIEQHISNPDDEDVREEIYKADAVAQDESAALLKLLGIEPKEGE